jgi:hypothetical protein
MKMKMKAEMNLRRPWKHLHLLKSPHLNPQLKSPPKLYLSSPPRNLQRRLHHEHS